MPKGELLKKLFYNYSNGDDQAFHDVATEMIRDEESKNNRVLANALRRNLGQGRTSTLPGIGPSRDKDGARKLNVVPFEREKQLPLVETVVPKISRACPSSIEKVPLARSRLTAPSLQK